MKTTKYTPSRNDGSLVYKMIFKRYKRFSEAYRTYSLKQINSAKVVNYDFGINITDGDDVGTTGELS